MIYDNKIYICSGVQTKSNTKITAIPLTLENMDHPLVALPRTLLA